MSLKAVHVHTPLNGFHIENNMKKIHEFNIHMLVVFANKKKTNKQKMNHDD